MTARNDELGQQKYNELCEKYPEDKERFFYHQLDITNEESITELINWIKTTFKKIDYLCNNAGVSNKGTDFNIETFNFTFGTNVYGTINFIDKMLTNSVFNKQGKIILSKEISKLKEYMEELKSYYVKQNTKLNELIEKTTNILQGYQLIECELATMKKKTNIDR